MIAWALFSSCTPRAPSTPPDTGGEDPGRAPFLQVYRGLDPQRCQTRFEVQWRPASLTCLDCPFTLAWSAEVDYAADPASDVSGCTDDPRDTDVAYWYAVQPIAVEFFETYYSHWALITDHADFEGAAVLVGRGEDPLGEYLAYPAVWSPSTGAFEWTDDRSLVGSGTFRAP